MLSRIVPSPFVRYFASPYVAGDSMEEAFDVAHGLFERRGVLTTLDLLGESVERKEQVESNVETYVGLVRGIASDPRFAATRPTISLKPSAFTTGEQLEAFAPIERIAAAAKEAGVGVTIDMEDRRWTDRTLELAIDLYRRGFDVGTVLQTRLNRTESDLAAIPEGMRIRLVIGIYPEPPDVAITSKAEMKERMIAYARTLLERKCYVELATHDEPCIAAFARSLPEGAADRSEVQMLLGVPRTHLQAQLMAGELGPKLRVRLYVPFAIGWRDATAYLRRRMDESPSMVWLVLRNLWERDR
jgi:proline dehydrogenase